MNILIVKLSAIGDVIHTLPALNALRSRYPGARITWLVEEAAAGLVQGHAALDRVIVSRRKRWIRNLRQRRFRELREIRRFLRRLRDTRYDLVLDFQALLKSGVLVALVRGDRKIGFDRGMEHMEHSWVFLNERVPPADMEMHALDRNLSMLEPLGIRSKTIRYVLPVRVDHAEAADRLLAEHGLTGATGPLIAVNCAAKWPSKLWPEAHFARLADELVEKCRARLVFTGSEADGPLVRRVFSHMHHPAVDVTGRTSLLTLAALYQRVRVLVSTDTGPMHLGAAVGIPVVAVFGPTAPWRTGPYGPQHRVVRAGLPCSPCFLRRCPRAMECMASVTPEQVFPVVQEILGD